MKPFLTTALILLTTVLFAGEQKQIAPNSLGLLEFPDAVVVDYAPKTDTDQFLKLADGRYVFWCKTPGLKVFAAISRGATDSPQLDLTEVLVTGDVPTPPVTVDVSELKGLAKNNKIADFYEDFASVVDTTTLINSNSQFRATYIDAGKAFFSDTSGIEPGTGAKIDAVLARHLGLEPTEWDKKKTVLVLRAIATYFREDGAK